MQNHEFGSHFFAPNVILPFFQGRLFNLNTILTTCLKNLFKKNKEKMVYLVF